MSKLIWKSRAGTFRLLDQRENLPTPLAVLCYAGNDGGEVWMTPEEVDELWAAITDYLHELPDEAWHGHDHGINGLLEEARVTLEKQFAQDLARLHKGCPWCGHPTVGHEVTSPRGERITPQGSPAHLAHACQEAGCSCVILGRVGVGE